MSQMGQGQTQQGEVKPQTEREKQIDKFVRQVKGSTEDVWTELFRQAGSTYKVPKLVNYDGMTRMKTGGVADSRMGPFYLPAEETIYIDTSFFNQMDKDLGGGGDFAYAYVIAHEVGHHVQKLTGKTTFVHSQKGRISDAEYNQLSVRLELQADFYAGVWAHHANEEKRRTNGQNLLEEGDIEEAMNSARAIGDDTLQRNAGQRVQPETFNHGTSEQRMKWFIKGIRTGDLNQGDTFSIPYNQL
jgi:predicted metalloprotease